MTWARFDDDTSSNPKVRCAGPFAGWLWFKAIIHIRKYPKLDGYLCKDVIADLVNWHAFVAHDVCLQIGLDNLKLAEKLVTCGLLDRAGDGYRVHDHAEYGPNEQELERANAWQVQKKKAAARTAKWRASKGQHSNGSVHGDVTGDVDCLRHGDGVVTSPIAPDPIRIRIAPASPPLGVASLPLNAQKVVGVGEISTDHFSGEVLDHARARAGEDPGGERERWVERVDDVEARPLAADPAFGGSPEMPPRRREVAPGRAGGGVDGRSGVGAEPAAPARRPAVEVISAPPLPPELASTEAMPVPPTDRRPVAGEVAAANGHVQPGLFGEPAVTARVNGKAISKPKRPPKEPRAFTRCPSSAAPAEELEVWLATWKIGPRGAMLDQFLDHHGARGGTFQDWAAAWRTWQRNDAKYAAGRGGGPARAVQGGPAPYQGEKRLWQAAQPKGVKS